MMECSKLEIFVVIHIRMVSHQMLLHLICHSILHILTFKTIDSYIYALIRYENNALITLQLSEINSGYNEKLQ